MKIGAQGYHEGKAWLCICVGVEPPFSKSWIRHCNISFCGSMTNLSYYLEQKHPTMCLIDFHGANIEISLCILII